MSGYVQMVLVQVRERSAEAAFDLVERALAAKMGGWRLVTDADDTEVGVERDDVRWIALGCSPSRAWVEVTEEVLGTWTVPASEYARDLSRHLGVPVMALASGDEGLGLQVFVAGVDRGRWATDLGDDARLEPSRPMEDWRDDPQELAHLLGDELRPALAHLPELAERIAELGEPIEELLDSLGALARESLDDDSFSDDPLHMGIDHLLRSSMALARQLGRAPTPEEIRSATGLSLLSADASPEQKQASLRALGANAKADGERATTPQAAFRDLCFVR
jgi:hypothetical protein